MRKHCHPASLARLGLSFLAAVAAMMLSLAYAPAVQAAITYVDAVPDGAGANVTVQGAAIVDGTNFLLNQADAESTDDGLWAERNRTTMNGGSVLESIGPTDAIDDGNAILWTSTPTLPAGTYNVYLFFWVNATGRWDIAAGIGEVGTTAGLTTYTKDSPTAQDISLATKTQYDGYDLPAGMSKDDGAQNLFALKLGQVVLAADEPITVSTAGIDRQVGDERTWFDGIGYQLVEPCADIPAVTVEGPIPPGATSVTVTGVSPNAQSVNVYLNGTTLIGSATGSPPNTPASLMVDVNPALAIDQVVVARQVVGGVEACGPRPETVVGNRRITYVDAVPNTDGSNGNTTVDGALVNFGNNAVTGTGADVNGDGLWNFRTNLANPGEAPWGKAIWEVFDADVTPLVTRLALAPGTYNLYGLVWNDGDGGNGGLWDLQFRVGSAGPYTQFIAPRNVTPTSAGGSEFVNTVLTREGNRWLFIAPLGQFTVNGPVDVYVDALPTSARTWYDGLGYELVEPSALPVTDGFGDGDRDNDGVLDDPDGSGSGIVDNAADTGLRWRRIYMDGTPNQTLRVAHDLAAPAGLGNDNALHVTEAGAQAYQVAAFPPTALTESGDSIRLTFQMRLLEVIDFGDTFRFGLFSDGVTTVAQDQLRPDLVADDPGYIVALATGAGSGPSHLAVGYPFGPNAAPLFGQDQLLTTEPAFDNLISDTLPHTVSLTVTRAYGGGAFVDVSIDGSAPIRALHNAPGSVLFFNQVAFATSPAQGIDYVIDDVSIEKGIAPSFCELIPPVTVDPVIPAGVATTITVNGILPEATNVNVYKNGATLIGTAVLASPAPATVDVDVAALAMGDMVSARQVIAGVESCRPAAAVSVGDCAGVPPVSLNATGLFLPGDASVTVTGVNINATTIRVYANGVLIGSAMGQGTVPVTVTVTPLVAGHVITATQTIKGLEGCVDTGPSVKVLSGKITYVDAVPNTNGSNGNTTVNGALVNFGAGGNATTAAGGDPNNDGLWRYRTGFANPQGAGAIWESLETANFPAPLVTTLTLEPGNYDLYGFFWTDTSGTPAAAGTWDVGLRTGSTGPFTAFNPTNAPLSTADAREFANTGPVVLTREGNRWMFVAPLGRITVSGPLQVYVSTVDGGGRTWYDGLGYVRLCPEPFADADQDGDVDHEDFSVFQLCYTGTVASDPPPGAECQCFDRAGNGTIDQTDLEAFNLCNSGPAVPADPACDD